MYLRKNYNCKICLQIFTPIKCAPDFPPPPLENLPAKFSHLAPLEKFTRQNSPTPLENLPNRFVFL